MKCYGIFEYVPGGKGLLSLLSIAEVVHCHQESSGEETET